MRSSWRQADESRVLRRSSPDAMPGAAAVQATPVLRLDGASVGYDDTVIVKRLSLRIDAGEVVALLGTNGSGKSTLVKGILGLAQVITGSIELFGRPPSPDVLARVGYVPQRQSASGPIPATVREVVMTGRLARRRFFVRANAADRAAVDEAIALVDLSDKARAAVTELSGGQHRRVLIARALAARPDLLIMDEPTAGVDSSQQETFVRTLQRLVEQGVTMLVVTHELGPMLPVITRALVLNEGRLSYDGPLPVPDVPELAHTHEHGADHHHDPQGPNRPRVAPDVRLPSRTAGGA